MLHPDSRFRKVTLPIEMKSGMVCIHKKGQTQSLRPDAEMAVLSPEAQIRKLLKADASQQRFSADEGAST